MKSYTFNEKPARCAILMSGSGSNTEALLEFERAVKNPCYQTVVLATDAPESSRAREIAAKYALPLVEHDIKNSIPATAKSPSNWTPPGGGSSGNSGAKNFLP